MLMRNIGKAFVVLMASTLFVFSAWYLTEHFQWREAFNALLGTDFLRLTGLVFIVQFAYIFVRTWRWRILVRHANPDVGFFDLYWITAVVVSLAILTPGQLGETLKIELLKRRGLLGRLPGLGAYALERILDVLIISVMGVVGLLFGSGLAERYPGMEAGAEILIGIGLVALFILLRFNPGGRASHWLAQIRTGSGSPMIRIKIAFLTIFSWFILGVGWQIALFAVNIHLSLPEILWLIPLVTLGTLLSFIPGGLGVAEVLTVEALVNMGVTPVTAQAGALILRAYALIVILFGLAHLILGSIHRLPSRARCHDTSN
jgi:uncharacterized membrane protein YbhN (UPF0104 family)